MRAYQKNKTKKYFLPFFSLSFIPTSRPSFLLFSYLPRVDPPSPYPILSPQKKTNMVHAMGVNCNILVVDPFFFFPSFLPLTLLFLPYFFFSVAVLYRPEVTSSLVTHTMDNRCFFSLLLPPSLLTPTSDFSLPDVLSVTVAPLSREIPTVNKHPNKKSGHSRSRDRKDPFMNYSSAFSLLLPRDSLVTMATPIWPGGDRLLRH